MTSELSVLADTLGANTAASLAFSDRKSATGMLGALRAERDIVAARLYDSKRTIFAEYRRDETGADFAMLPLREDGAEFRESSLTLYRTVLLGGEKSGAIAIVSDLGALQAKIREYTEISVVVILFSVLATYLLSSRLLRLITEPILHLAQVATRVTTNEDYAVRAIPRGEDEVGALIGSFNQMLERIQERDAALQGAKGELELRVQARTQELQLEVNERIRTEETLSEERKVLRALIDNVPDFMYVKDAESRFVVANASLARSMGVKSPEELLHKTDFDFYPKELADAYYRDEQNVIRTKQPLFNREEEAFDADGNKIWVLTTKVPLYDKNGQVTGIAGVGRDITHLKKTQEEMQKAREAAEAAS